MNTKGNGGNNVGTIVKKEDNLEELLARVNKSNPSATDRAKFVLHLRRNPEVWKQIGDIATATRAAVLQTIANFAAIETTRHKLQELREELGYDGSPTLEQLLIDHILNCYVHCQVVEFYYVEIRTEGLSIAQGLYWEKRLSAVQRRYLKGVETLAKVRKMKLPNLHVSIGARQVNMT